MSSDPQESAQIAITPEMERRYRQNAAGALVRLTPSVLRAQVWNAAQWLLIALSGLIGLYYFDWSALSLLLVFVAGHTAGVTAEALKWLLFRREYHAAVDAQNDDRLVWAMVMAYRKGERRIFASALTQTDPGHSVMVDAYALGAALALLGLQLRHLGVDWQTQFADRWWLLNLGAALLVPFMGLTDLFLARRGGEPVASQQFQPGGRGLGLLLVVAAFLWLSDSVESVRTLMLVIFALTVLVALIAGFGLKVMADQRVWLAANLPTSGQSKPTGPPAPQKPAAAGRSKRKSR